MTEACRAALLDHSWPGNVRELQNVIERGVILCMDCDELQVDHLGLTQPSSKSGAVPSTRTTGIETLGGPEGKFHTLDKVEKHHILMALERCRGNRTHAAKELGISVRTLRNKLNEYRGKRPGGRLGRQRTKHEYRERRLTPGWPQFSDGPARENLSHHSAASSHP